MIVLEKHTESPKIFFQDPRMTAEHSCLPFSEPGYKTSVLILAILLTPLLLA